ncbi:MAG: acetolactate synthase small subunit [Candidatus Lambdaproteobacteria bacterium]|nr:acetolactate synthase small subunit [Candidatus Lambdaproteobacteria bacterium]
MLRRAACAAPPTFRTKERSVVSLPNQHTISVMVENRPGVLARVSGLFARRGFNINSLAVSATEDPEISRMTVVTTGDTRELEQIIKQLNKLIDVITIYDHTDENLIEREIALIKVHATVENRSEIMQLTTVFRAEIVNITPSDETMIIEITGDQNRVDAFLETLAKFDVLELVRTGKIALVRGARAT